MTNRIIKFRAWNGRYMIFYQSTYGLGETGSQNDIHFFADRQEQTNGDCHILMQFTGLLDKNGKEIYEGDIFLCHYAKDGCIEQPMVVVYHKETASFKFKRRGICQQPQVIQNVYDHAGWRGEIIGNIYENKDLLK